MWDLKSGDAAIEGSAEFSDYRQELISWDEYAQSAAPYCEQVSLPSDPAAFTAHARTWLESVAQHTDECFPSNESLRIENGEPVLSKLVRRSEPEQLRWLEKAVAERLETVSILDMLADTDNVLRWTRSFGPLSGHEAKLDQARERYLAAVFCYGCNLGPSQTARLLKTADRRQIAWG
jgi:hypothetical protein